MLTYRSVKPPAIHCHTTTRQSSHSPADGNLLDDRLTRSLLPLPTMSLATCWALILFLCAEVSPSFSLSHSSYSWKTVRTTARWLASTNGGSSRWSVCSCVSYAIPYISPFSLSPRRALGLFTGYEPALLLLYRHYPCLRTVQTVIRALFTSSTPTHAPSRGSNRRYVCSFNPHPALARRPLSPCASWLTPDLITLPPSHHPHTDHRQHPCRLLQS